MKKLIIASIFLVPLASIVPIQGTIVWYPQLLALMLIGLVFIALQFFGMNKFISIFLVYAALSYLLVTEQSPRAMLCLICGFSAVAVAYATSKINDNKIIYKCIAGFAAIQCLYVILQKFGVDPFFIPQLKDHYSGVVGFLGSHNQLGIYYACTGIILASIHPALIVFAIIPIVLAKCNGAMLGLLSGFSIYLLFTGNKKLFLIMAASLVIVAVPYIKYCGKSHTELMERINLWKQTVEQTVTGKSVMDMSPIKQYADKEYPQELKLVKANPLFGFGIGNFFVYSPRTQYTFLTGPGQGHRYEHAHNDPVEALFEFGYLGFGLIFMCVASVVSDFIICMHSLHPNTKNLIITFSCLVAMSVSSLSVYVFHAPVSLFMFFLMLGLFYKEVRSVKV